MNFPASVLREPVLDLKKKPIMQGDGSEPLTVVDAIRFALTTDFKKEENPDGDKKFKNYRLAMRLLDQPPGGSFELSAEEITEIKDKARFMGGEIVGFLFLLLEAPEKKEEPTKEIAATSKRTR